MVDCFLKFFPERKFIVQKIIQLSLTVIDGGGGGGDCGEHQCCVYMYICQCCVHITNTRKVVNYDFFTTHLDNF